MSETIVMFSLILTCLIFIAASDADAVRWKSVVSGSLNSGVGKFKVFVDADSIRSENGKVWFWQRHVFYTEQTLPSAKRYVRVSIKRVVDCAVDTASTLEAVFYSAEGLIVENY